MFGFLCYGRGRMRPSANRGGYEGRTGEEMDEREGR